MSTVKFFRDLDAWQAAMGLAVAAHILARSFPAEHRFELASQIRRSATSIPSNVAEGHAQRGDRVFLRHIRIALGSLAELETQLELAMRLGIVRPEGLSQVNGHIVRTGQLLHGLRRTLADALKREGSDSAGD
jgi:four helix bundle protein